MTGSHNLSSGKAHFDPRPRVLIFPILTPAKAHDQAKALQPGEGPRGLSIAHTHAGAHVRDRQWRTLVQAIAKSFPATVQQHAAFRYGQVIRRYDPIPYHKRDSVPARRARHKREWRRRRGIFRWATARPGAATSAQRVPTLIVFRVGHSPTPTHSPRLAAARDAPAASRGATWLSIVTKYLPRPPADDRSTWRKCSPSIRPHARDAPRPVGDCRFRVQGACRPYA